MNANFEELLFNVASLGSETLDSIKKMSTYEFFRYKQFVTKKINKNVAV